MRFLVCMLLVAMSGCAAERHITASFLIDGGLTPFDAEGPVFMCRRVGPDQLRCADMRTVLTRLQAGATGSTRDNLPGDDTIDGEVDGLSGETIPYDKGGL